MAKQIDCPRCNGTGELSVYRHVRGGMCFKCSGSGKVNAPRKRTPKQPVEKPLSEAALQYQRDVENAQLEPLKSRIDNSPFMIGKVDHPNVKYLRYECWRRYEAFGWPDETKEQ